MFLGYKVNTKGIKVCSDKVDGILSLPSLNCLKDMQKLNGKLASLNRFLAKSAEKSLPFFKTLKKYTKKFDFYWTEEAESAFKKMKQLIAKLPTLTAPEEKEKLIVYLAATKEAVSTVLMTEREAKKMAIYFFSRALRGPKVNYTPMEKLVLALVHASKRLKRYLQAYLIIVITDQPIKQVLSRPEVEERTRPDNFKVALHSDFPGQEVVIRGTLSDKGRTELCSILKKNLDIFAWQSSDMTGASERAKAIQVEVQKLVDTGIRREVYYHDWLSNPVMKRKQWRQSLAQGVYCYTKMPFGLKNAGATYHWLMDKAFDSQIGRNIEVYVDELVVKSYTEAEMLRHIEETFRTLRRINMKLNPKKSSNNEAEYEALIASLQIAAQMGVKNVHEGGKKAQHQGPTVRINGGNSLQAVVPYAVVKMCWTAPGG
nr:reverse transcriptase domain-containing protein [Tanacetum cinerariifolium]